MTKWNLWGPAVNTTSSCLFLDLLVSVQMMTTVALCALLGSPLYVTPTLSHALQQFFTERIYQPLWLLLDNRRELVGLLPPDLAVGLRM